MNQILASGRPDDVHFQVFQAAARAIKEDFEGREYSRLGCIQRLPEAVVLVLPAPMAGHWFHAPGIGLVQGGAVQDQDAALKLYQPVSGLIPPPAYTSLCPITAGHMKRT